MIGILPFLIQWLAISQLGNRNQQFSFPPKSHWTLLSEFQQLPEDEIESFLPQICNILIEREASDENGVYDNFERILIEKCSGCLTFGIRVCGLLKAAAQGPSEGIFKLNFNNNAIAREDRLRRLQEHCEAATSHGNNLPSRVSQLRSSYYRDCQFLTDTLARLGTELKSYPVQQRSHHLRSAIAQVNGMLHNKMLTRGVSLEAPPSDAAFNPDPSAVNFAGWSPQMVAQACPDAAAYSLHLPLLHCRDKAMRLLQFVESECEVLPSKERCPYVLVAELLEQPFTCKSEELYTQGHEIGVTIDDVIQGRLIYHHANRGGRSAPEDEYLLPQGFDGRGDGRGLILNRQSPPQQGSDLQWPEGQSSGASAGKGNAESVDYSSLLENSDENHCINPINTSPSEGRASSSSSSATESSNVQTFARDSFMSDNSAAATSTYGHTDSYYGHENVNTFAREDISSPAMHLGAAVAAEYLDELPQYAHTQIVGHQHQHTHAGSSGFQNHYNHNHHPAESSVDRYAEEIHADFDFTAAAAGAGGFGSAPPAAAAQRFTPGNDFRGGHTNPPPPPPPASNGGGAPGVYDNWQSYTSAPQNGGAVPGATYYPDPNADPSYLSQYPQAPGGAPGSYMPNPYGAVPPTGHYGGHDQYQEPIYPDQYGQYGHQQQQQPQQQQYDPQTYSQHHQHQAAQPYGHAPHGYDHGGQHQSEVEQFNQQMMRKTFVKGKTWEEKRDLVQRMSAFGHLPGWTLKSFIVKSGDDLRKEQLAMQIIDFCQHIFKMEDLDIFLRPYQIISTGQQAGLVEFLEGARSIDRIKKSSPDIPTLKEFFQFSYGAGYSVVHARAVNNFVKSLVGYSLLTYLLQVKDRHNANILVDTDGRIIHIDFGFILGDSPGFNINFESAPFKLTREYLEVMGGLDSAAFKQFEDLFVRGFFALQKHVDGLCAITQLFYGNKRKSAAESLRSRLMFARTQADVLTLIRESLDNWRTKQYDWYQQRANNILM